MAGAHARRHTRAWSGRARATDRRSTTRRPAGPYPEVTGREREANEVPTRAPPAPRSRTRTASCPHRARRRAAAAPKARRRARRQGEGGRMAARGEQPPRKPKIRRQWPSLLSVLYFYLTNILRGHLLNSKYPLIIN